MIHILNYPHIWNLLLAWFLIYLTMPAVIAFARKIRAMDRPGGHKAHGREVAFLGGVGIFIAFSIAVLSTIRLFPNASLLDFIARGESRSLFGVVLGSLIVLILGLIDDFHPIRAVVKLGVILAVTVVIHFFGVQMTMVHTASPLANILLNVPLTVIWIAGVTSAMNSLDNMDGVASGTAAVASIVIFYIAWGTSPQDAQPWLSYLAVALFGACLGFLRFNFLPARVFLGDNGSFLLGFLLASMLVLGRWSPDPFKSAVIPCVILTVPLFDITLTTILRIKNGIVRTIPQAIAYSGRDHISHRLQALGLSPTVTVLTIYLLACLSGFIAVWIFKTEGGPGAYLPILAFYIAFLVVLGVWLDRAPVYPQEDDAPSLTEKPQKVEVP
ncbi:MAG: MraY family glycosyltransferase [Planctomycetota bacterium]|nr:MraY family glycosyltransferase [Planctomycetota bacterium]